LAPVFRRKKRFWRDRNSLFVLKMGESQNLFSKVALTTILQTTFPICTVKWQALRGNICSGRGSRDLNYLFLKGSELTVGRNVGQ